MAKSKRTKEQRTIYKTLHRKQKVEQLQFHVNVTKRGFFCSFFYIKVFVGINLRLMFGDMYSWMGFLRLETCTHGWDFYV